MLSLMLIVSGMLLLVVTPATLYWIIRQYEARIATLEAQLRLPCPVCQAAAAFAGRVHERS